MPGGLGRSRAAGETLADQAEVKGGDVGSPAVLGLGEEAPEQPVLGERC